MIRVKINEVPQRLGKVNTLLSTCQQGNMSFGDALLLSLFYSDFNDTNRLIKEAEILSREDTEQLLDISSSLLREAEIFLYLDRSPLQMVDFEAFYEKHLKPSELQHEEAKAVATKLWREYSTISNRLDFLLPDSDEYKSLDMECDAAKVKYDEAHAHVNLLYKEWMQEREKYFCVYCFKPVFLEVLVSHLKGIAGSIISDIRHIKESKP